MPPPPDVSVACGAVTCGSVCACVSPCPEEHAAATNASTQRRVPSPRMELGADRGRLEDDALARVGKRRGRVVGVDLAGEAMAVVGRLRDDPGRDAVPDPVERVDAFTAQRVEILCQLEVERLVGEPLRRENDGVRLELHELPELVRPADEALADLGGEEACALANTDVMEVLAEHRSLERFVRHRCNTLE